MDEEVSDVHVEEQEDDTQSDMNTSSTAQSTKRPTSSGTGLTKRQKKESQEDELMKRAIACMEKVGDRNSKQDDDDVFGLFVASELRSISDPQCKNRVKWQIKSILCNVQPQFTPTSGWNLPPSFSVSTTASSPSPCTGKDDLNY